MINNNPKNLSSTKLFFSNFSRKKLGVICAILVITIYLVGIFAPFWNNE